MSKEIQKLLKDYPKKEQTLIYWRDTKKITEEEYDYLDEVYYSKHLIFTLDYLKIIVGMNHEKITERARQKKAMIEINKRKIYMEYLESKKTFKEEIERTIVYPENFEFVDYVYRSFDDLGDMETEKFFTFFDRIVQRKKYLKKIRNQKKYHKYESFISHLDYELKRIDIIYEMKKFYMIRKKYPQSSYESLSGEKKAGLGFSAMIINKIIYNMIQEFNKKYNTKNIT